MGAANRLRGAWRAAGQALQRILLSALPLLFFVLHATGVLPLEFVQRIENYLYDVRVGWMMPNVVDPRVVIVDIDETSLAAEGQWPWPRAKIAALNDALFDVSDDARLGISGQATVGEDLEGRPTFTSEGGPIPGSRFQERVWISR